MLLPWQSILVICRSYGAPAVSFPGCTIMLYQCHMPSAGPMVCQLYNTVIHCDAGRSYDPLVQSCYTNVTCRWLVQWCASCIILSYTLVQPWDRTMIQLAHHMGGLWCAGRIILSYTPMPAGCMIGCMIPWL